MFPSSSSSSIFHTPYTIFFKPNFPFMGSNPPSTSQPPNTYIIFSKLMVSITTTTLFLTFFLVHVSSSCNQIDKDSLLSFSSNISTLSPHPPLNWSLTSDCCDWEGITCDQNHQHVTHLFLPSRGLSGFISLSGFTSLQSLSHLNLSYNKLHGNLQNQFFSILNHLLVLDLSYNRFYGELPLWNGSRNSSVVVQVFNLSSNSFNGTLPVSLIHNLAQGGNLIAFNVSNNSFTGQIPVSNFCVGVDKNSSLRFLDFSSNDFDGAIETGLGACSKLERFRAGFNHLSRSIPIDIYDAVSLIEISLPLNKIDGTIGDGIVNLTNLTVLELYSNHLIGSIPKDIGKLLKLEKLLLHVNNLTGMIPPSLMNCNNLVVLNLRVNRLKGNLSAFNFSGLVGLATLDLGNNRFTGVLPPTLYDCKSLAALRLASNQLEGQLSSEIHGLESLSFLSISDNRLKNITGALRILAGLKKLSTLMLSKNFYFEYNSLKSTMKKPTIENAMTCKSNFKTLCVEEGVPNLYSLDITNAVEELTITAGNIKFNNTSSSNASGASNVKLLCFARHGAMPTNSSYDYSSDLNKSPLVIHSPLIGRWYIRVLPVNLTKTIRETHDGDAKVCYSLESQMLQCPFGKTGQNCTMSSYALQTVLKRGTTPFESYYLPIGEGASSAKFPIEPLFNNSSKFGETSETWIYFTLDIPHGAAGRNIHVQLSSDTKISYEVYARLGGLPSVGIRDYYYANKTSKSDPSVFFMLYDSSDKNIDFYLIYAREGTWSFGLRHVNASSDSLKQKTIMSISLEGCPNQCSCHGDCKAAFDATGLTSYSFCECDRNHGGFDCSIEIVSHKGHILQSIFLIGSNAAALLPAYWSLRQKAFAEWILFTASGIASGIYHACDVGTWCALNFSVLQFMDFWLSFVAVISTFVYLATIDEAHKRAIHTAVSIFTALIAATNATRSSNVVYVIVIGALGLLIGWLIEMSSKYRSSSFSFEVSPNFHQSMLTIKQWLYNLVKALIRRFRWGFIFAGFAALIMAGIGWTLETSETYWIWHSFWHAAIYTSSFFFLCSKASVGDAENRPPRSESYELARQDSFSRE